VSVRQGAKTYSRILKSNKETDQAAAIDKELEAHDAKEK